MSVTPEFQKLLDDSLRRHLDDPARRRLTALWMVDKVLPERTTDELLDAAAWVADHARGIPATGDADERFVEPDEWTDAAPSTTVPDVDLGRLRRVVTEAGRLCEFLDIAPADGPEFDRLLGGLRDAALAALAAGSTEYGLHK